MLTYKEYKGEYVFDEEEAIFRGKVTGINDAVIFEGKSLASLQQEFIKAVDLYIEWRRKYGKMA